MTDPAKKPLFSKSNILNGVAILALAAIVFVPAAKALLIRGLMGVGLFRADVAVVVPANSADVADIGFQTLSGQNVNLTSLKGKVVLLNFWATWCPPCRAEMPSLNSLRDKLKNNTNIAFVMVDADGDLPKSQKFLIDHSFNLPLYKLTGAVADNVYTGTLPTTIIVNKAGKMVFRHEGMANYDTGDVRDLLEKLAKE